MAVLRPHVAYIMYGIAALFRPHLHRHRHSHHSLAPTHLSRCTVALLRLHIAYHSLVPAPPLGFRIIASQLFISSSQRTFRPPLGNELYSSLLLYTEPSTVLAHCRSGKDAGIRIELKPRSSRSTPPAGLDLAPRSSEP